MRVKLWTINRFLRWTGFRFGVAPAETEEEWTTLSIFWAGLYGSDGWMRWEPWTKVTLLPLVLSAGAFGAFCLVVGTLLCKVAGL